MVLKLEEAAATTTTESPLPTSFTTPRSQPVAILSYALLCSLLCMYVCMYASVLVGLIQEFLCVFLWCLVVQARDHFLKLVFSSLAAKSVSVVVVVDAPDAPYCRTGSPPAHTTSASSN